MTWPFWGLKHWKKKSTSWADSWRYTNSVTRLIYISLSFTIATGASGNNLENLLRSTAKDNGLLPAAELNPAVDASLAELGEALFTSEAVSLNGNISCETCHLDNFSSADGLPNAIGVGGQGEGMDRLKHGGAIVPRNTFALFGRGGIGFNTLFWDGKVDVVDDKVVSQFGGRAPSDDPLIVAVHLPPLEIREMIVEDKGVANNKKENVSNAIALYQDISKSVQERDPELVDKLAGYYELNPESIEYSHIAEAIAAFIRHKFAIRDTKFHRFVFEGGALSEIELKGANLFYGKGKCTVCHAGPYFTDFRFHAIPMPQAGFGKNGFGVDYGRYNVTHDVNDLYKFRTPPLYNVAETSPYGHSGSVDDLETAIAAHFDPLRMYNPQRYSSAERTEYFKRLLAGSGNLLLIPSLSEQDISDLIAFLQTLTITENGE